MKQGLLGSLFVIIAIVFVQLGMVYPQGKQPLGLLCMFLALLAILLGIYGLIRALFSKKNRLLNVLLFLFNLLAGTWVGFLGFALMIPS